MLKKRILQILIALILITLIGIWLGQERNHKVGFYYFPSKRLVAFPGQTVKIDGKTVTVPRVVKMKNWKWMLTDLLYEH